MARGRQVTSVAVNTETTIVTADAAYALDLYSLTVANRSVTDVDVIIKDATGGSQVWRWAIKGGTSFGFRGTMKDPSFQTAKNANWTITVSSAVTAIEVTAEYVQRAA